MLHFGSFTCVYFFKGKCGSWSAPQVKQTWPLSPYRSWVASLRALDLGMLSSNLLGTLNTSNWIWGGCIKFPDLYSFPWYRSNTKSFHQKNFTDKGPSSQSYGFSSSHVWMWELDYKESQAPKNWCFWIVVLEKTLKSPLDCKEIQSVHSKGNQSWIIIARADVEAEIPILWPPDVENWLTGKVPDCGKDWRLEKTGTTEDEMAGWHHWLNGQEFEQAPGVGYWQGSLACCSPWGHKESDMTEWLNWTEYSLSGCITVYHLPKNLSCFQVLEIMNKVAVNVHV